MDDSNTPASADPYNQNDPTEPDLTLQGYQDDFATGDKTDIVQEQQGDSPSEFLGVPEDELKTEFDKMAGEDTPPPTNSDATSEDGEDWREHVEDMDEDDKEVSTDSSWTNA